MASRNPVVVTGNLAADPESFAAGDFSGVRLTVVENIEKRQGDKWVDDEPAFWPVTVWGKALAANVLASLRKGARVTVVGHYRNNVWEGEDGNRRSRLEVVADEVAVSLQFATATVTRASRSDAPPLEPPF